ncbi:GNAT family N-acetyltransferase [Cytobacillus firmus]|nr:GNAT family N-acetyltransferase [Cytobacillus firmus]
MEQSIRVIALITDKNYRGIGAGKKLMLAVENFAEQLGLPESY